MPQDSNEEPASALLEKIQQEKLQLVKEGKLKKDSEVILTDLPGIYSLSPYTLEEVVARNYLIGERPDAIINLVDGTNLERNLYLTTQLMELGIPVVVAINMLDVLRKNGDKINMIILFIPRMTDRGCMCISKESHAESVLYKIEPDYPYD